MNYFDDATLLKIIDLQLVKAGANETFSIICCDKPIKGQRTTLKLTEEVGIEINSIFEEDEAAKKLFVNLARAKD